MDINTTIDSVTLGDGLYELEAFIMQEVTGHQRVAVMTSGDGLGGEEEILEEFLIADLDKLKEFCKKTIDLIESAQKHNADIN